MAKKQLPDPPQAHEKAFKDYSSETVQASVSLLNESRGDALACRAILLGQRSVEEVIGVLSTTESIVVALACGREDLLPRAYPNFREG